MTLAREAERQRRRELERHWNKIEKRSLPPQFARAAKEWLEKRRHSLALNTYNTYRYALKHLQASLGNILVCDIEVTEYQRIRIAQGAAPATVNKEVACLISILSECGVWEHIKAHQDVRTLREPRSGGRALGTEEEVRLLNATAQVGQHQGWWSPIYPVTVLAVNTGLRHSEIQRLRWQDANLETRVLVVAESKTDAGTGRFVPLNGPAWAALDMWSSRFPGRKHEDFVFPACENGVVDPSKCIRNWRTAWRNAREKAGLASLRFHDLRHTTATKLLEQGVPFAVVAELLGWSTTTAVRMAKRYGHIRPEVQRRAMDSIASGQTEGDVHQIDNQTGKLVESRSRKSLNPFQ
jgi:integrase